MSKKLSSLLRDAERFHAAELLDLPTMSLTVALTADGTVHDPRGTCLRRGPEQQMSLALLATSRICSRCDTRLVERHRMFGISESVRLLWKLLGVHAAVASVTRWASKPAEQRSPSTGRNALHKLVASQSSWELRMTKGAPALRDERFEAYVAYTADRARWATRLAQHGLGRHLIDPSAAADIEAVRDELAAARPGRGFAATPALLAVRHTLGPEDPAAALLLANVALACAEDGTTTSVTTIVPRWLADELLVRLSGTGCLVEHETVDCSDPWWQDSDVDAAAGEDLMRNVGLAEPARAGDVVRDPGLWATWPGVAPERLVAVAPVLAAWTQGPGSAWARAAEAAHLPYLDLPTAVRLMVLHTREVDVAVVPGAEDQRALFAPPQDLLGDFSFPEPTPPSVETETSGPDVWAEEQAEREARQQQLDVLLGTGLGAL